VLLNVCFKVRGSQGSVATYLRRDGSCCSGQLLIANLLQIIAERALKTIYYLISQLRQKRNYQSIRQSIS